MNILSFILICIIVFLVGVIVGITRTPKPISTGQSISLQPLRDENEELEKINVECRNFLSYDGSEQ